MTVLVAGVGATRHKFAVEHKDTHTYTPTFKHSEDNDRVTVAEDSANPIQLASRHVVSPVPAWEHSRKLFQINKKDSMKYLRKRGIHRSYDRSHSTTRGVRHQISPELYNF